MKHLFTLSEWLRAKWERFTTLASSAMQSLKATKRQSDTTIFAKSLKILRILMSIFAESVKVSKFHDIFANYGVKDVRVSLGQYLTKNQLRTNLYLTPNSFFTRFAAVFALVFVMGVGNVWAKAGDEITTIANIVSGKTYYIKGVRSNNTYYLTFTDATGSQSGTESTTTGGAIPITFTQVTGGWNLTTPTGKYIAPGTSNGKINVSASAIIVTASASNQNSKIRLSITSGTNTWSIQKNTSAANFGGYKNTQADITLIEAASSYTITAQSNNTSWGTVSGTSTITASPKAGYRVSTSSPYSVSPANSAIVSQNGNTFTVTPSANTTVTINFEAIPTHKISFNTGGLTTIGDATGIQEGAVYNITQTPAASLTPSCEYGTFVGWTTASSIANPSVKPALVSSVTMSTSDVTLHAVYSKTVGGGGASGSIELTTETENFPTAYGTANTFTEYTLGGKKFKIQQGYVNGTKLQWRANGNSNGTGIIYNTEVFSAKITSVVLVYDNSDTNKNFTVKVGDSENPTSGTAITPSTNGNTYTFDCSEESVDYFVLTNGSGAGYLTSITINYGSNGTTTYSLDANCCEPLAQINGSINLSHF